MNGEYWSRERIIWGKSGEKQIRESNILIIGSSKIILLSELLISLNYIGVNKITLVDNLLLEESEYGKCIALLNKKENIIGREKIQVVEEYVRSLNSRMNIDCICKSPREYIESLKDKSIINEFSVIICINISNKLVSKLINYSNKSNVFKQPVINLKSYSFIGTYQIHFSDRNNLFLDLSSGSKNISKLKSLQLDRPIHKLFKNSSQFEFSEFNYLLNKNTDIQPVNYVSKIPFPVLILKCKSLVELNNKDADIRSKVIELLNEMSEKYGNCKNFQQALYYMRNIYSNYTTLEYLKELTNEKNSIFTINEYNIEKRINNNINFKYKIILNAIYEFYTQNNRFPVSNEMPDIHCDTISYLEIEKIYNEQYKCDLNDVYNIILKKHGDIINLELLEFVCKYFYCFINVTKTESQISHKYVSDDFYKLNSKFKKSILRIIKNEVDNNDFEKSDFLYIMYHFLAIDFYSHSELQINKCNFGKFNEMFRKYLIDLRLNNYFNDYISINDNLIDL